MKIKMIYQDSDLLVVDKPAGVDVLSVYPKLKKIHRLDKETSGVLLIAKNEKALIFFQKQFKKREVEKKYLALIVGNLKSKEGEIKTLLGRSPKDRRKQKVYLAQEPQALGKREAETRYKVLQRFENYDLIEVVPKTGRKHQIRCHLSYLGHPIAGDKMYSFKNQACPKGLKRQFLHASYIKIQLPNGKTKEFTSGLPDELKKVIDDLKITNS